MRVKKTRQEDRGVYRYPVSVDDGKGGYRTTYNVIKLGDDGVTEVLIKSLHAMDDAEVYNNLKNWKTLLTEQEKEAIKKWEAEHPGETVEKNWHISMDGLQATEDADSSKYMAQIQNLAAEQDEDTMRERVYACLEELGEDAKKLYQMRFLMEYTQEEIAEVLHISQNAVSKKIRKLKEKLIEMCR